MGVSRSGYYKWRKRNKSTRDLRREEVIALVSEVHKAHPSHGYRWVAAFIRVNYQQDISDNYVYKAFRFLGIKAKTKHQVHYRPRKIRDLYPNLIFTTWDTVDRPRQVIVSDMTVWKPWIFYLELTLYFDVFTKQILTWKLSERRGGREQYLDGLADISGVRLVGPRNMDRRVGVISVDFLRRDNAEMAYALEAQYGILTRCGLHCAPSAHKTLGTFPQGTVRFSLGWASAEADVDAALAAIRALA